MSYCFWSRAKVEHLSDVCLFVTIMCFMNFNMSNRVFQIKLSFKNTPRPILSGDSIVAFKRGYGIPATISRLWR